MPLISRAVVYRSSSPFARWDAPNWPSIGKMLKLGLPIGVTYFAEVSAFTVVGLLVAKFGVVMLSSHQIALNFSSLLFMAPLSLGIGLITRVGQMLGEGDPLRVRFAAWVGVVGAALSRHLASCSLVHKLPPPTAQTLRCRR